MDRARAASSAADRRTELESSIEYYAASRATAKALESQGSDSGLSDEFGLIAELADAYELEIRQLLDDEELDRVVISEAPFPFGVMEASVTSGGSSRDAESSIHDFVNAHCAFQLPR